MKTIALTAVACDENDEVSLLVRQPLLRLVLTQLVLQSLFALMSRCSGLKAIAAAIDCRASNSIIVASCSSFEYSE